MTKLKVWIAAARLRTLPLSVSGILIAAALAQYSEVFNGLILALSLATTLGFQILSNFANDYGDGIKGTDNHERVGPARALQSGALSAGQLKKGMWITSVLTLSIALLLIYVAFGKDNFALSIVYFLLGIAAIAAAIKYTVGSSAYGYRALGDLFVFIFFGIVSVAGGYFLYAQKLPLLVLLSAVVPGVWSAAVLNLNNMRDRKSDINANKITLAVKLGEERSKFYHSFLLLAGIACGGIVTHWIATDGWHYIPLLAVVPLLLNMLTVWTTKEAKDLDPELKKVALSTFLFSLLLLVTQLIG
ncbi:MAG: 1,4-dihydroxy-2-naphthoate octaprenyltransferase [Gilvibacter sp.]